MTGMHPIAAVRQQISQGRPLLLAGDECLLRSLPRGNWIGASTPDSLADGEKRPAPRLLHVAELPESISHLSVRTYDRDTISSVYTDARESSFSIIIIPAASPTHLEFALHGPGYRDFAVRPLVGWVSGAQLGDPSAPRPKVFSGPDGAFLEDGAVVMHATLPPPLVADVGIVNLFEQDDGDTIRFLEDGFSVRDALVNDTRVNLAEYVAARGLDIRLPLVANYYGAMVNVSFLSADTARREVRFYAPVFAGVTYKHAKSIDDYRRRFVSRLPDRQSLVFSCNCILNFRYSGLSTEHSAGITGFLTFGEVAYQLLNQTMVYLTVDGLPAA